MHDSASDDRNLIAVARSVVRRWQVVLAATIVCVLIGLTVGLTGPQTVSAERYLTVITDGASSTSSADRSVANVVQVLNDPAFQNEVAQSSDSSTGFAASAVSGTDFVIIRSTASSVSEAGDVLSTLVRTYESRRDAETDAARASINATYAPRLKSLNAELEALPADSTSAVVAAQIGPLLAERTRIETELDTQLNGVTVGLPNVRDGGLSTSMESTSSVLIKSAVLPAALGLALGVAIVLATLAASSRIRRPEDLALWLPSDVLARRFRGSAEELPAKVLVIFQELGLGSGSRSVGVVVNSSAMFANTIAREVQAAAESGGLVAATSIGEPRVVTVSSWKVGSPLPHLDAQVGVVLVDNRIRKADLQEVLALGRTSGCHRWAVLWTSPTSPQSEAGKGRPESAIKPIFN